MCDCETDYDYVMPQVLAALSAVPAIKIDALMVDETFYMQGYLCAESGGEMLTEAPHPRSRVLSHNCSGEGMFESWLLGWTHAHVKMATQGEG